MAKPTPGFTIDEIEGLLAETHRDPELRGFTTRELADAAGCSPKVARERYIRPLVRAGRAKPAMLQRQPELSPYWQMIKGYLRIQQEGES